MIVEGAIIYSNLLVLLALGLALTYITTGVPNFAQGSFAIVGSYLALTISNFSAINPYFTLPFLFVGGGILGAFCYTLLRPLIKRKASIDILMIATLAIDLILLGVIGAYSDILSKIIGFTQAKFVFSQYDFYLLGFKGIFFMSLFVTLFLLFSLFFLLYKTKFGTAMRAAMENPALAVTVGIDISKTRLISWILSGGLAAVAGGLLPFMQEIVPLTGSYILVSIFAASIVGGLSNITGALLGGYVIGFSESIVTYYLTFIFGSSFLVYGKVVSLIIMIITLLLAPKGLVSIISKFLKRS